MAARLLSEFLEFCEPFLAGTAESDNLKLLIKLRYRRADEQFLNSTDFSRLIHSTRTKIRNDKNRFFVHFHDFLTELKAYKKKSKKDKSKKRKREDETSDVPKKKAAVGSDNEKCVPVSQSTEPVEGSIGSVRCEGSPYDPEVTSTCSPSVSPKTSNKPDDELVKSHLSSTKILFPASDFPSKTITSSVNEAEESQKPFTEIVDFQHADSCVKAESSNPDVEKSSVFERRSKSRSSSPASCLQKGEQLKINICPSPKPETAQSVETIDLCSPTEVSPDDFKQKVDDNISKGEDEKKSIRNTARLSGLRSRHGLEDIIRALGKKGQQNTSTLSSSVLKNVTPSTQKMVATTVVATTQDNLVVEHVDKSKATERVKHSGESNVAGTESDKDSSESTLKCYDKGVDTQEKMDTAELLVLGTNSTLVCKDIEKGGSITILSDEMKNRLTSDRSSPSFDHDKNVDSSTFSLIPEKEKTIAFDLEQQDTCRLSPLKCKMQTSSAELSDSHETSIGRASSKFSLKTVGREKLESDKRPSGTKVYPAAKDLTSVCLKKEQETSTSSAKPVETKVNLPCDQGRSSPKLSHSRLEELKKPDRCSPISKGSTSETAQKANQSNPDLAIITSNVDSKARTSDLKEIGRSSPKPVDSKARTSDLKEIGRSSPNLVNSKARTSDLKEIGRSSPNLVYSKTRTSDLKKIGRSSPKLVDSKARTSDLKEIGRSSPKLVDSKARTSDLKEIGRSSPKLVDSKARTSDLKEIGRSSPKLVDSKARTSDLKEIGRSSPKLVDSKARTSDLKEIGRSSPKLVDSKARTSDLKEIGRSSPKLVDSKPRTSDLKEIGRSSPKPFDSKPRTSDLKEIGKSSPKPVDLKARTSDLKKIDRSSPTPNNSEAQKLDRSSPKPAESKLDSSEKITMDECAGKLTADMDSESSDREDLSKRKPSDPEKDDPSSPSQKECALKTLNLVPKRVKLTNVAAPTSSTSSDPTCISKQFQSSSDRKSELKKQPTKEDNTPFLGEAKTAVNEKHIRRLEVLLAKLRNEIEKQQAKELSLDDLEDDDSSYIYEDRLQKKFVKVWNKLCELKGRRKTTGRPSEQKFNYEGTRYPEINKKIESFINKKKMFPDFHDIKTIIVKVNKRKNLNISTKLIDMVARDAFTDVGNQLQERRKEDFLTTFGSRLTDGMNIKEDPALKDSALKKKLEENRLEGKHNLDAVISKYTEEQFSRGLEAEEVGDQSEDEKRATSTSPTNEDEEEEEEDVEVPELDEALLETVDEDEREITEEVAEIADSKSSKGETPDEDENVIELSTEEEEDEAQSDDDDDDDDDCLPKTFQSVLTSLNIGENLDSRSSPSTVTSVEVIETVDEDSNPAASGAIYMDIAEDSDVTSLPDISSATAENTESSDSDICECPGPILNTIKSPARKQPQWKLSIRTPQKKIVRKALGISSTEKRRKPETRPKIEISDDVAKNVVVSSSIPSKRRRLSLPKHSRGDACKTEPDTPEVIEASTSSENFPIDELIISSSTGEPPRRGYCSSDDDEIIIVSD